MGCAALGERLLPFRLRFLYTQLKKPLAAHDEAAVPLQDCCDVPALLLSMPPAGSPLDASARCGRTGRPSTPGIGMRMVPSMSPWYKRIPLT